MNEYFYQHPKSISKGSTDINGIVGDIWLFRVYHKVKKSAGVVWDATDIAIEAVNKSDTSQRFDLEPKSYDFTKFIPDSGGVQAIAVTESRNFFSSGEWDEYNYITIKRVPGLDDADFAVFEVSYPIKLQDQDWKYLAAGKDYFQNPTNNWSQYSQAYGWEVQFNLYTKVTGTQSQVNLVTFTTSIRDYNSPAYTALYAPYVGYPSYALSVDFSFWNASESVRYAGFVASDGWTMVVATIQGDFNSYPTGTDNLYGVLYLCNEQTGGCDTVSSELGALDTSVWAGSSPINPLIKTASLTFNTARTEAYLKCLIDGKKINKSLDISKYYFAARIGYDQAQYLLAQEQGGFITQENGFGILTQ